MGDFLFGTAPSATPMDRPAVRQDRMAPEQMKMFESLLGIMGGGPSSPMSTGFVGGYSPMEQKSIGMLEQYMTKAGGFDSPEYFEQMIKKPLVETWKEDIMPEIGGEFGKRGLFYGSGRREAEERSGESLMDILAKGKVETERMGRDMGLQEMLGMGQMGMSMGGVPMQRLMQLIGVNPYQFTEPTTQVDPGQEGFLQQAMSAAGPIMMGAAMLSDKRLKKNLIKIGSIKNVPFYAFQYIWDKSRWHIGTTAQDILKKYPKSVLKIGRYFAVNYERLMGELQWQ